MSGVIRVVKMFTTDPHGNSCSVGVKRYCMDVKARDVSQPFIIR